MKKILFTVFTIFSFTAHAAFPTAVNSQISDSAAKENLNNKENMPRQNKSYNVNKAPITEEFSKEQKLDFKPSEAATKGNSKK